MSTQNKLRSLFVLVVAMVVSVIDLSPRPNQSVTLVREAHAVVGRPLTPVSYAGVARRTTRRAVYAGAATPYAASPYW
jgi:hypothetical protein